MTKIIKEFCPHTGKSFNNDNGDRICYDCDEILITKEEQIKYGIFNRKSLAGVED